MTWLKPRNLEEALDMIDKHQPKVVSGGTDLFVNWQIRKATDDAPIWLDIHELPELKQVKHIEGGLEIGAAVTAADIWQQEVFNCVPALQQAARIVGGWQIQNRATLGGNLANASPAADMVVPLAAYKAIIHVQGINGARHIPIAEFLLGPRRTALAPGELITSIFIPEACLNVPQTFMRHDQRGGTDISIISVAVVLKGNAEQIEWGSAAVGGANPVPYICTELEEQWQGCLSTHQLTVIADQYAAASHPITDVRASAEYRQAMIKVYIQRAVKTLITME